MYLFSIFSSLSPFLILFVVLFFFATVLWNDRMIPKEEQRCSQKRQIARDHSSFFVSLSLVSKYFFLSIYPVLYLLYISNNMSRKKRFLFFFLSFIKIFFGSVRWFIWNQFFVQEFWHILILSSFLVSIAIAATQTRFVHEIQPNDRRNYGWTAVWVLGSSRFEYYGIPRVFSQTKPYTRGCPIHYRTSGTRVTNAFICDNRSQLVLIYWVVKWEGTRFELETNLYEMNGLSKLLSVSLT